MKKFCKILDIQKDYIEFITSKKHLLTFERFLFLINSEYKKSKREYTKNFSIKCYIKTKSECNKIINQIEQWDYDYNYILTDNEMKRKINKFINKLK